ncbi:MAG: VTT domain-containing protein, partial [Dehalococcoidia bacterium]
KTRLTRHSGKIDSTLAPEELATQPPPDVPENLPPVDPGAELQKTQQYVQFWHLRARLEFVMLAVIGLFAGSVATAFILLDLGEDDLRSGTLGYAILWIISLLRASSVLLPIPGSGLTVAAGAIMDPLWGIPVPIAVGVTAGTAESIGEFTGYYAGINGGKLMEGRPLYEKVSAWIKKAPFPTMFVMAFMPSPVFDVAGLAAGAARVPIRIFYPAILLGKIGRGIIMAAAGYYASAFLIDLIDVLQGEAAGSILDSTEGKIAAALVVVIALAGGAFIIGKYRDRISKLI